jgi:hypothetical protein
VIPVGRVYAVLPIARGSGSRYTWISDEARWLNSTGFAHCSGAVAVWPLAGRATNNRRCRWSVCPGCGTQSILEVNHPR